ncbi:hypothetical protein B5X24_HaOG211660 [Helicoverpa armigera]|uniref:Uncharacterized protein n=1 Tax=Helicoverpa armigera TaxID=29058 RepID=A0A2W1BKR2_HELAM|nr:hypothetical protein B5X24_HaOG211660 [Helicoverpa armigera]
MIQIIIFLNVITLITVSCHDVFLGYADLKSRLIYSKGHEQSPAVWMRSDVFTVNCSRNEVISAIQIIDLRIDKLGEVNIRDGGIGAKFVTIELYSPGTYLGLNFWVEVFALKTSYFLYNHGK